MKRFFVHAAILATLCISSASCNWPSMCGEDEIKLEMLSPGGTYAATVAERNCGATTSYSTFVTIRNAGSDFDPDEGEIFVARGRYEIKIDWVNDSAVNIKCEYCPKEEIFRKVEKWDNVNITYSDL